MNIQSPSGNIYSHITGGYIRLKGRLGNIQVDRLPEADWRGDRGGHYTYDYIHDITEKHNNEESESYPDRDTVSCLPIATYDRANEDATSLQVYCILLRCVDVETMTYSRIGWMSVLDDWEADVHEELIWITNYARTAPLDSGGLDTVTIV